MTMRRRTPWILAGLAGLLLAVLPARTAAADCYFYNEAVGYVCNAEPRPQTFVQPEPFKNSFLERMVYARAADFTNVYPEPNATRPPVRNMGDGYLWVTVMGQQRVNGELWYQITPGEFVRGADLTVGEISEFIGVQVQVQPERPFGWMVADRVRPSTAPGVEPDETFDKMSRYTFFQVFNAAVDEEGWIWYDIGGGRWMKQIYVSLVEVSPRPDGVGPTDLWVEVDLYEQSVAAYEGDRMVFASLVSSGLNRWPTHEGLFQVWDRWTETKMSGAEGKIDYYFIEDVPHTMYFDYDIALHGAYWHDRFGYKHSHGCVNMPPLAAEWVYNWSANAPVPLWVTVYTSDPHHYFETYADEDAGITTGPDNR